MTDILPQPADTVPTNSYMMPPVKPRLNQHGKRTVWILISLIILGVLCLVAAYFYDYSTNHNEDNTKKQDIAYIASTLNSYYSLYHNYPTLRQLNGTSFSVFAPGLNKAKFKVPDTTNNSEVLEGSPTNSHYAYEAGPLNCNNTTVKCTSYKLITILSNGQDYSLSSPKH